MRIKRPSIASSPAIKRRRYENVVTSQSSPAIFPVCLLAAGVEDSESCRDRCHAWYLMSTCVRAARASGSRDPSPPLYIHLGSLNHLCTEPLSPAAAPAAPFALGTRRSPLSFPPPRSERTYRYRAGVVAALCTRRERRG